MTSIPDFAAVNETVKLARQKGERAFVNGVLRAAERQKNSLPMPPEAKNYKRYLSVKYSFPLDTVKHFDFLFGREDTEALLKFYNETKYTDITVNTTKISVDEYAAKLASAGYETVKNNLAPRSLRILSSVNPERLPGFAEGYFFVQDRASAVCTEVLAPERGDVIIDVCAAPGGKSFGAAVYCGGECEIHAFDLHESKLSLISSGVSRLGFDCITSLGRNAIDPDRKLVGTADRVICDAPCSGLGVLGKKADLRYKDIGGAETLPAVQLEILTASARYLKEDGILVYSTCTLNPTENEDVVSAFLAQNPDFEAVPFVVGDVSCDDGMLTLMPHVHHTDGFFMAKIRRKI
jgi:16S rRNA (cytosine967-C5)-methyltransferase